VLNEVLRELELHLKDAARAFSEPLADLIAIPASLSDYPLSYVRGTWRPS
jgi:hypothetical protein